MEDDRKKEEERKTTSNKIKNGRQPQKKWKNQSTKINLIGCDTIVNSPSLHQK